MKGALEFDPDAYAYGPATRSVRAIFRQLADVDWFARPVLAARDAVALAHEHVARAHRFDARTYAEPVRVEVRAGDWADFTRLCATVRDPGARSDWKFGVLKPLAKAHARAHGWTAKEHAARYQEDPPPGAFPRGYLVAVIGGQTLWLAPWPKLDLSEHPAPQRDDARWYVSYADMDALECITWQLAEASDDLATNPFAPLLACYAGGYYPFATSATTITLLSFGKAAAPYR